MSFDKRHDPENFLVENLVRRADMRKLSDEYNCQMARIFPWPGVTDTKRLITEFGLIWVEVVPGTAVDAHEHDEEESFCIVQGRAHLILEGQETELTVGDVVYIPRFWRHQMCNPFDELLKFVDIYWDDKGRTKAEARMK